MAHIRLLLLLICIVPVLLSAAPSSDADRPLTVVLDFDHNYSNVPFPAVQDELQKLLAGAHVTVTIRLRSELPAYPQLGEVVIFKMRGLCSVKTAVPVAALSDERGALAMTYTNSGQILPFGEVECDRLRRSLARIWGPSLGEKHENEFGMVLARVMAHEIYHILGDSSSHTKTGVTKESLSARDLSSPDLGFPNAAANVIAKTTQPK